MLAFDADVDDAGPLDVESLVGALIDAPAADDAPAPATVGPFALLRLLGRGGMGEVWLAERDSGGFRQQVALKRLRSGRDSEELRRRFVQERRILADLSHAGIARFIDGGVDEAGAPWYAMELVEGVPITDFARARGLDLRARVALVAEVAEAVAYAQNRLVVHRDLKPSNILIDADGRPRLLDFGIAKILDDGAGGEGETAAGMRAMTPDYAAPEQILGEPISTATDVYALGVVLYQLLTGDLPHARGGASLESLVDSVRSESTERPSARLRRVSADRTLSSVDTTRTRAARALKGDLDTIAMTALRREPELRYPAAAALAADLRRWLDERPIAAQPDTSAYRLRKFVARHRFVVGSASAVLLALIAGLGIALWQADVARRQSERAETERMRAEEQTARAEAALQASTEAADRTRRVKEFMMRTLVAADPMQRPGGGGQTVNEAFEEALKRIDTEVADDPKLQVDLLDDFGEVRSNQGRFDDAKALFARALAQAETLYPADDPVIAETLLNQVAVTSYAGNTLQALPQAERAAKILRAYQDALPMQYAKALGALTMMRNVQGQPEEALALALEALEVTRKHYDPRTEELAATLNNVANGLLNLGRHAEAEPYAREAAAEIERVFGPEAPRLADVLNLLQMIVYRLGRYDEATELAQRRLRVSTAAFGERHPMVARVLSDLASDEEDRGNFDAARAYYDTAIDFMDQADHEGIILILRGRGLLRRSQGDNAGALADFDAGIAECLKYRPDDVLCQVLRANRAGHLARIGRGDEALAESDAVLAELKRTKRDDDNEYAQALESRAFALQAVGRTDEARQTQELAIARYVALFGEDHREAQRARGNLAKLGQPSAGG